jgi:hypothetical protein
MKTPMKLNFLNWRYHPIMGSIQNMEIMFPNWKSTVLTKDLNWGPIWSLLLWMHLKYIKWRIELRVYFSNVLWISPFIPDPVRYQAVLFEVFAVLSKYPSVVDICLIKGKNRCWVGIYRWNSAMHIEIDTLPRIKEATCLMPTLPVHPLHGMKI